MKTWRVAMKSAAWILSLGVTPFVAGCNTTEGALWGAGLGAGTGALAGGLSRHAGAGTAIGAGAGALLGGIMGSQFEQMEKQKQAQQQPAYYPPSYPAGGTGPYPAYPQSYQGQSYPQGAPVPQAVVRGEPPQKSYDIPKTATPISTVVQCPKCGQSLDVSDFRKGTKVRCPACNEVFVY